MALTLSRYVTDHPAAIDSTLTSLTADSARIIDIDVSTRHLSVLTASSVFPAVVDSVREFFESSKGGCGKVGDDESALNIALCHRLENVSLGNNRLQSLLGVCVFTSVQALVLSNNRISSLEMCEPLGLLEHLERLDLTGNPVTRLLNYRAHVLRICSSWKRPSERLACRLKALDSLDVCSNSFFAALKVLAMEESILLPVLDHLRASQFATAAIRKIQVHRELRRKGFVCCDPRTPLSMLQLLKVMKVTSDFARDSLHQLRCDAVRFASSAPASKALRLDPPVEAFAQAAVANLQVAARNLSNLQTLLDDITFDVSLFVRSTTVRSSPGSTDDKKLFSGQTSSVGIADKFRCRKLVLRWRMACTMSTLVRRCVLRRCCVRWHRQVFSQVQRRADFHRAAHFHTARMFTRWRVKCTLAFQNRLDKQLGVLMFAPKTLLTSLCRQTVFDEKPTTAQCRLALTRVWKTKLLRRRNARRLLVNFFCLWCAWGKSKKSVECRKLDDSPVTQPAFSLARELNEVNSAQCDSHRRSVCEACDVGIQTEPCIMLDRVQHITTLAATLQKEKLLLVRQVFELERQLASGALQLHQANSDIETYACEIKSLRVDQMHASAALQHYESERQVHLAIIQELRKALTHQ